jgi:predicted pyridoxine 5'-phosphate oxidase superfamily flavin-nucleotide-binding protein
LSLGQALIVEQQMTYGFLDIALTPSVRAAQAERGVDQYSFSGNRDFDRFTDQEVAFIARRDTFYIASVSETGWPYVQHRGGPPGFLKTIDDRTLAFADFRGNRQYISTGNFRANDRACLILVDYPQRARLKIYAHVEELALDADRLLAARVLEKDYRAKPERIFRLRLDAFDWNCPQHITPRFTEGEIAKGVQPLRERIEQLERENAVLRGQLDLQGGGDQ